MVCGMGREVWKERVQRSFAGMDVYSIIVGCMIEALLRGTVSFLKGNGPAFLISTFSNYMLCIELIHIRKEKLIRHHVLIDYTLLYT